MLNVLTVKTGRKYTHGDVNRVFRQCVRYLDQPFSFYCYTDNTYGLNPDINCIPYEPLYQLDGVWNKMMMFKPGFGNIEGKVLYLDLDVVILNNIDRLADYTDEICAIECHWKSFDYVSGPARDLANNYGTRLNTSVMTWMAGQTDEVWNTFKHDVDWNIVRYSPGMDRFMYHNGLVKERFPKGWIYSYLYGTDYEVDFVNKYRPAVLKDRLVCLLNGDTDETDYIPFVDYFV